MTWRQIVRLAGTGAVVVASGCGTGQQAAGGRAETQSASARPAPEPEGVTAGRPGWRPLFDGATMAGWRAYQTQRQPAGWTARDGVLSKTTPTDDIITVDQFGDFELELEWRIAARGNAGVFYRATEEYEKVYWSAPEYQLLDDAGAGASLNRLNASGALYDLYPAPAGHARPAGEWNLTRIVVTGPRVEHWLNGERLLVADMSSPEWTQKVQASKFGRWPAFGRASRGHIAIQGDHAGELSLRNIRIREPQG